VFNASYTGTSVIRTTQSHTGTYAVLMQTAINAGDTVNGIMLSADSIGQVFGALFGNGNAMGFPYALRPANLTGFYKFTRVGGDSALMGLVLTKWNSTMQKRDTISYNEYQINNTATAYTFFNLPITYTINAFPDTALIMAGIDGPNGAKSHVGTLFFLDDLAFTGSVPFGINELVPENMYVNFYPNPMSNRATIVVDPKVILNDASLVFYDMLGNEVKSIQHIDYRISFEKGELPKGMYFYRLLNNGIIITHSKFMIE